ncbi:MAG: LytR/AlgR family response regulator transcription factor, partial [Bacteroidia bacterium]
MPYTCLIVDDNEIERDAIEMYLRKIDLFEIVGVCSSGIEAATSIAKNTVDIVFSDIDMPELSGMG